MPWKVISLEVKDYIVLYVKIIVSSFGIFKIPSLNKQSLVITYVVNDLGTSRGHVSFQEGFIDSSHPFNPPGPPCAPFKDVFFE